MAWVIGSQERSDSGWEASRADRKGASTIVHGRERDGEDTKGGIQLGERPERTGTRSGTDLGLHGFGYERGDGEHEDENGNDVREAQHSPSGDEMSGDDDVCEGGQYYEHLQDDRDVFGRHLAKDLVVV